MYSVSITYKFLPLYITTVDFKSNNKDGESLRIITITTILICVPFKDKEDKQSEREIRDKTQMIIFNMLYFKPLELFSLMCPDTDYLPHPASCRGFTPLPFSSSSNSITSHNNAGQLIYIIR